MAAVASAFYGHPYPALTMVGVTGTNGKTTVTHLVQAVLEHAGIRTGLVGTLAGSGPPPSHPTSNAGWPSSGTTAGERWPSRSPPTR